MSREHTKPSGGVHTKVFCWTARTVFCVLDWSDSEIFKTDCYKNGVKKLFPMRRQEAVELLREIVASCHSIHPNHISLKTPSDKDTVSEGYELHIKDHFDETDLKCLKGILRKRSLRMKTYDGFLAIYKQRKE
jgi:hypothetical protein